MSPRTPASQVTPPTGGWTRARHPVALPALVTLGVLALAGCASGSAPSGTATYSGSAPAAVATPSISGSYPPAYLHTLKTADGSVVLDSNGSAIYVFTADSPGHSACTGSCLTYWPPVPAPTQSVGVPGITATLGSLARSDGTHQLTINGMPAYTYVGDTTPGDIKGEGLNTFGGHWWLVAPDGSEITGSAGPTRPASPSPSAASSTAGGKGYGY